MPVSWLPRLKKLISSPIEDAHFCCRANLEDDLAPLRRQGPFSVLDFLDLLNDVNAAKKDPWSSYVRNHVALMVIRNNELKWWAHQDADGLLGRRVRSASTLCTMTQTYIRNTPPTRVLVDGCLPVGVFLNVLLMTKSGSCCNTVTGPHYI